MARRPRPSLPKAPAAAAPAAAPPVKNTRDYGKPENLGIALPTTDPEGGF